jgi:predicted  nucleic acid-binding Zn-ribbon protein
LNVAYRFFSKSTRSYIAPGIAPRLQSQPVTQRPLEPAESAVLATELDALSVFLPEGSSSMSARARARVSENLQAASRYASVADVQHTKAASQIDAKYLEDFRKLFRQTQQAVEQLKGDASAIRDDLSELRSLGEYLGQGYTRLGDICRLTERRSELTVDALDAIEKRISPLEVVRDLSATTEDSFASLKQLAEEVMQCGARFEAQKEAIDRGREEATRVVRLMDELQARVAPLTEWLREAEATVGRLEHRAVKTTAQLERRATATMAELERRLDGFDGRKRAIEQTLFAACTQSDEASRQAEETVGRLEQQAAETTAQFERRVSQFDAQRHAIEQALATALTESDQRLAQAQEAVRRLEHEGVETAIRGSEKELRRAEETAGWLEQRAAASMDQLERRIANFDALKSTIERAAEATRVMAVLSALKRRVAALLVGSDRALGQAERAIGQLERRIVEARVRVGRLVWSKSDVKYELERVRTRLQTLTKSARNSVNVLRSAGPSWSSAWKIKIGRPHLRWAAVLGVLVAVNLLGIVMLLTPDQPSRIGSNAPAAVRKPAAPVSLLPSTVSHFAMFDMPAGRASTTPRTIAARKMSSTDRRDWPQAAPTVPAAGASQAGGSKEPVQYVGKLTVDSEPAGSAVFVDRQLVGETPLELTRLRAGSHVVRIERDGYDRWTTAVHVAADKQTRVSVGLQAARDR